MTDRLLFPKDDDESGELIIPKSSKPARSQRHQVGGGAGRRKQFTKADHATRQLFADLESSDLDVSASAQELTALLPELPNHLIRASAGTGKTYQLTSRFLRLLLLGVSPETILATTFTRKAAGEILDRVVTWLARAATEAGELKNLATAVDLPALTHEDCLNKLAVLTRQVHRLQIHTIDAFFMQMAGSFSLELGLTPGWQVLEEGGPESNGLRAEAISRVLRQESLEDLLTLVHQLAPKGEAKRSLDRTLQGSVSEAYRLFVQSSADAWDQLEVPAPLPEDALEEVREAMANYRDPKKRKSITEAIRQDVHRILNEDWSSFFGGGKSLAKSINEGKEKYGNAKLSDDLIAIYDQFLPHLRSMTLFAAKAQTVGTYRFLAKYDAEFRGLKEGRRLYGFDEVTQLLANHAQAENLSQLTFRMDHGIDHLLLDEFQDTSTAQWRALSTLAHRCTQTNSSRSFFCVGDVKQAIYGWRGGSSEIFDVLDEKLPNVVNSDLQESRRSSPVVIEAVNRIFEFLPDWDPKRLGRAARAAQYWQFPEHSTFHQGMPGYFAIETSAAASGFQKEPQEAAVFRRTAERVAELSRRAHGCTIGILCRRNSKVGQMMNELQRLGVAASEEGGNFLTDSAAVELVLSLLQLIDHPADSVAAFHLASSPWGEQLGLEVDACPEFNWKQDDPTATAPGRPKPPAGISPQSIGKLVRTMRARLLNEGFGDTVQGWAAQLRAFSNRREARRLAQLVERAFEYQSKVESPAQLGYQLQRRQSSRPSEFVRFIRETKVADPSGAMIRVMTVHQAKGLEFDAVFLPDLLGPFVEGHETFLYRRPNIESDIDLVCRYMGKDSGRSFLPKKFLPLFDEFEDRGAREALCVLYVALTRAAHALHVILPSGMQKMRGSKAHSGYLIKDAFLPGQELQPEHIMFEAGEADWFSKTKVALEAKAVNSKTEEKAQESANDGPAFPKLARSRGQRRNLDTAAPSLIGKSRYVHVKEKISRPRNALRDRGSVVHLWLSQINWFTQTDFPNDEALIAMAQPWGETVDLPSVLQQFKEMLLRKELHEVLNRLQYESYLRNQIPDLPSHFILEVRTEQPVAGRESGRVYTGTIDRLILVRSAVEQQPIIAAEIIDYKTETHETQNETAKEKFRERYEMQIDAYRRMIETSLQIEKVFSRLVFLP